MLGLHDHHHLSQARIADLVGRTQGWVSTRLALYRCVPDDLLALIRKGSITVLNLARLRVELKLHV